jgi:hypothetical protein
MALSAVAVISGYGASNFRFCLKATTIISSTMMDDMMMPVYFRILRII